MNRSKYRVLFIVVGVLVCILMIGTVGGGLWYSHRFRSIADERASKVAAQFERYLADSRTLPEIYQLPRTRMRNASAALNPVLRWRAAKDASQKIRDALKLGENETERGIPDSAFESMMESSLDWFRAPVSVPEVKRFDFSWMKGLDRYDYWDPYEGLRSEDIGSGNIYVFHSLPSPAWIHLMNVAKLRLRKVLLEGEEARSGLQDARNLARLLLTEGSTLGGVIGNAILGFERETFEELKRLGRPVKGWTPIPKDVTDRAKKMLRSSPELIGVFQKPEITRKIVQGTPVGVCIALNQAVSRTTFLRSFLRPHVFFEEDYTPRFDVLSEAISTLGNRCSMTLSKVQWNLPDYDFGADLKVDTSMTPFYLNGFLAYFFPFRRLIAYYADTQFLSSWPSDSYWEIQTL